MRPLLLMADPFSWTAFFISLALTGAQYVVNRIFGPKPPKIERGKLSGDLFIQNSEEGLPIAEVLGAAPDVATTGVTWTNLTLCIVQADNSLKKTSGNDECYENADGTGDGGARTVENITTGDFTVTWNQGSDPEGRGFGGLTTSTGYTNDFTQLEFCIHVSDQNNTSGTPHPPDSVFVYEFGVLKAFLDGVYTPGDTLKMQCLSGIMRYYHKETLIYTSARTISYPLYFGASIACLNKTIDDVAFVRSDGDYKGGIRLAGNIAWAKAPVKVVTTEKRSAKGAPKQTVETTTYYTNLAILGPLGPLRLKALWANADKILDATAGPGQPTGLYDTSAASGGSYTQGAPPQATASTKPGGMFGHALVAAANGTAAGQLAAGLGASIRVYEGNYEQLPDSAIEAEVDAAQGTGSTPAFRGRFLIVLENFNISKYGSVPTFTMLVEHAELDTLGEILDYLATEVGIEPGDRDFSACDGIECRGYVINNRQSRRLCFETLGLAYNAEFYESVDGILTGLILGGASVQTLNADYLGAIEGEALGEGETAATLDTRIIDEIQLPRVLNITAFDPAKDYEKTSQPAYRMTGFAVGEETIDLPMTLEVDTIRQIAERSIYRRHVESNSDSATLPPVYGFLDPAQVVTVTADGLTHRLRIQGIRGALPGALEFNFVEDQAEVFTQTIAGGSGAGYTGPAVEVPIESIAFLFDVVNLRDTDNSPGYYAAVGPAAANGSWNGAVLYEDRGAGYDVVGRFATPATMGVTASSLAAAPGDAWDYANVVDVDLYGDTTLESATEAQVLNGVNACVIGEEVLQFMTATQLGGYVNRWRLSNLLRGRRGSEYASLAGTTSMSRFALLNSAVAFLEKSLVDRNIATSFKAVTAGFSLQDTASTSFTWDCQVLKPLSVVEIAGSRDGSNNLTITWMRRSRIGHDVPYDEGADPPLGEETERYEVDIMSGLTVLRTITATSPTASYSAANQTTDGLTPGDPVTVQIYQMSALVGRGQTAEATI